METPSHVHRQDPSRPRVMPRKDRSHHQRAPKAARVPRPSSKMKMKEEKKEQETEVKVKVRSTVVDIDSVRKEEVKEENLGLLEAAEQEDGLKRKNLNVLEWLLMVLVLALVLLFLPLSIWFCVKVVREHERAVVFRLGHLLRGKPRGPGWNCFKTSDDLQLYFKTDWMTFCLLFYLPILDVCHIVDIRLKMLKVPPHTVVTKDLARPELSAVCYYQIENVALCSAALSGLTPVLQTLVQAAVRDVAAQHTFNHILLHRRRMGQQIHTAVDAVACRWGIRVERADMYVTDRLLF
uniref:Podocin n=1 Tax=Sphaeramia orbicularis TaxID=375764 RepID=A0A673CHU1_9TELE